MADTNAATTTGMSLTAPADGSAAGGAATILGEGAAASIVDALPHRSTTYVPLAVPHQPLMRGSISFQDVKDGEKALSGIDLCSLTPEGLFSMVYLQYAATMQRARDVVTGGASTADNEYWSLAFPQRTAEATADVLNRGVPVEGSVLMPIPPDPEGLPSAEALQRHVLGTALLYNASAVGRPNTSEVFQFLMGELTALVTKQQGAKQPSTAAAAAANGAAADGTTPPSDGAASLTNNNSTNINTNSSNAPNGNSSSPLTSPPQSQQHLVGGGGANANGGAAAQTLSSTYSSGFADSAFAFSHGMLGMEEQFILSLLLFGGGNGGQYTQHQQQMMMMGMPPSAAGALASLLPASDISTFQLRAAIRAATGAKSNGGLPMGSIFGGGGGVGQHQLSSLMMMMPGGGGGGHHHYGINHHQHTFMRASNFSASPSRHFSHNFVGQLLLLLRRYTAALLVVVDGHGNTGSNSAASAQQQPQRQQLPANIITFIVVTVLSRRILPEVLELVGLLEALSKAHHRAAKRLLLKSSSSDTALQQESGEEPEKKERARGPSQSPPAMVVLDAVAQSALSTFTIRPSLAERTAAFATNMSVGAGATASNSATSLGNTAAMTAAIDGVCHDATVLKVPLAEGAVVHTFCVSRCRRYVAMATNEGVVIYDLQTQSLRHAGTYRGNAFIAAGIRATAARQQQQHGGTSSSAISDSTAPTAVGVIPVPVSNGGSGDGPNAPIASSSPSIAQHGGSAASSTSTQPPAWSLQFNPDATELLLTASNCKSHTRLSTITLEVINTYEVEEPCYALFVEGHTQCHQSLCPPMVSAALPESAEVSVILGNGVPNTHRGVGGGGASQGNAASATASANGPVSNNASPGQNNASLTADMRGDVNPSGDGDDREASPTATSPSGGLPGSGNSSGTSSSVPSPHTSGGGLTTNVPSPASGVGGQLNRNNNDNENSVTPAQNRSSRNPLGVDVGGLSGGRNAASNQRANSIPQGEDNFNNTSHDEFIHRINAGAIDPSTSFDNILSSPEAARAAAADSAGGRHYSDRNADGSSSDFIRAAEAEGGRFALFESPLLPYGHHHEATCFCAAADTTAITTGTKASILSHACVSLQSGANRTPALVGVDNLRVAGYIHDDFLGTIVSFENLIVSDENIAIFIVDNVVHCTQGQMSCVATLPKVPNCPWRYVCVSWEAGTFSLIVNGCIVPFLTSRVSPARTVSVKTVHLLACSGHVANVAVWTGPLRLSTLQSLAKYKRFASTACSVAGLGSAGGAHSFSPNTAASGYTFPEAATDSAFFGGSSPNNAALETGAGVDGLGVGANRITPIAHLPLDEGSGIWLKELVSQTPHVMLPTSEWDTNETLPELLDGGAIPPTYAALKASLWPSHFPPIPNTLCAFDANGELATTATAASAQSPTYVFGRTVGDGRGRRGRAAGGTDSYEDDLFDAFNVGEDALPEGEDEADQHVRRMLNGDHHGNNRAAFHFQRNHHHNVSLPSSASSFSMPHYVRVPATIMLGSRLVHSRFQTVLIAPLARPGTDMLLTLTQHSNVVEHITFAPHVADSTLFLDYNDAYCYTYQQRFLSFSCARARTVHRNAHALARWMGIAKGLNYRTCEEDAAMDEDDDETDNNGNAAAAGGSADDRAAPSSHGGTPSSAAKGIRKTVSEGNMQSNARRNRRGSAPAITFLSSGSAPPLRYGGAAAATSGVGGANQRHNTTASPIVAPADEGGLPLTLPRLIEGIYAVMAIESFELERAPRHFTAVSATSLRMVAEGLRGCGARTPFVKVLALLRLAMVHFRIAAAASDREATAFAKLISPSCRHLMNCFPSGPLFTAAAALFRQCVRVSQSPTQKADILCCATDGQNKTIIIGYLALASACEIVSSILPSDPAKALAMFESLLRACCKEIGCEYDENSGNSSNNATVVVNTSAATASSGNTNDPLTAAPSPSSSAAVHHGLTKTRSIDCLATDYRAFATGHHHHHHHAAPGTPQSFGHHHQHHTADPSSGLLGGAGGGAVSSVVGAWYDPSDALGAASFHHKAPSQTQQGSTITQHMLWFVLSFVSCALQHGNKSIVADALRLAVHAARRMVLQRGWAEELQRSALQTVLLPLLHIVGAKCPEVIVEAGLDAELLAILEEVDGAIKARAASGQRLPVFLSSLRNAAGGGGAAGASGSGGGAADAARVHAMLAGELDDDEDAEISSTLNGGGSARRTHVGGMTSNNSGLNSPSFAAHHQRLHSNSMGVGNSSNAGPPQDPLMMMMLGGASGGVSDNGIALISESAVAMDDSIDGIPPSLMAAGLPGVLLGVGAAGGFDHNNSSHRDGDDDADGASPPPLNSHPSASSATLPYLATRGGPDGNTTASGNYNANVKTSAPSFLPRGADVVFSCRQAIDVQPISPVADWRIALDCTQSVGVSLTRDGIAELSVLCVKPNGDLVTRRLMPREPSLKLPHGGTLYILGVGAVSMTLVKQFKFRCDHSWVSIVRDTLRRTVIAVAHKLLTVPPTADFNVAPVCRAGLTPVALRRRSVVTAMTADLDNGESAAAPPSGSPTTFSQDVFYARGEGKAFADEVLLSMRSSVTNNMKPAFRGMLAVLMHCGLTQSAAEDEIKAKWISGEWAAKLQGEDRAASLRSLVELSEWVVCNIRSGPLPSSPSEAQTAANGPLFGSTANGLPSSSHSHSHMPGSSTTSTRRYSSGVAGGGGGDAAVGRKTSELGRSMNDSGRRTSVGRRGTRAHQFSDIMDHLKALFTKGVTARQLEDMLVRRTQQAVHSTTALGLLSKLLAFSRDKDTVGSVLRCIMQVPLAPGQHYIAPFGGCGIALEYSLRSGFHTVLGRCLDAIKTRWIVGAHHSNAAGAAGGGRLQQAGNPSAAGVYNAKQRLSSAAPDGLNVLGLLGIVAQNWDSTDCDIMCGWDPQHIIRSQSSAAAAHEAHGGGGGRGGAAGTSSAVATPPPQLQPQGSEEMGAGGGGGGASYPPLATFPANNGANFNTSTATAPLDGPDASKSLGDSAHSVSMTHFHLGPAEALADVRTIEIVDFVRLIVQSVGMTTSTPLLAPPQLLHSSAAAAAAASGATPMATYYGSNGGTFSRNSSVGPAGSGGAQQDNGVFNNNSVNTNNNDLLELQSQSANVINNPRLSGADTVIEGGGGEGSSRYYAGGSLHSAPTPLGVPTPSSPPPNMGMAMGGGDSNRTSLGPEGGSGAADTPIHSSSAVGVAVGSSSSSASSSSHELAHLMAAADTSSLSRIMPNGFRLALPRQHITIARNDKMFIVDRGPTTEEDNANANSNNAATAIEATLRCEDGWPLAHQLGMPRVFYFEVTVAEGTSHCGISLVGGFNDDRMTMYDACEYDCSGQLSCQGQETRVLPPFGERDTVGCGFIPTTRRLFFTLNGHFLGFSELLPTQSATLPEVLFPTITRFSVGGGGGKLFVNFGTSPFHFDFRRFHPALQPQQHQHAINGHMSGNGNNAAHQQQQQQHALPTPANGTLHSPSWFVVGHAAVSTLQYLVARSVMLHEQRRGSATIVLRHISRAMNTEACTLVRDIVRYSAPAALLLRGPIGGVLGVGVGSHLAANSPTQANHNHYAAAAMMNSNVLQYSDLPYSFGAAGTTPFLPVGANSPFHMVLPDYFDRSRSGAPEDATPPTTGTAAATAAAHGGGGLAIPAGINNTALVAAVGMGSNTNLVPNQALLPHHMPTPAVGPQLAIPSPLLDGIGEHHPLFALAPLGDLAVRCLEGLLMGVLSVLRRILGAPSFAQCASIEDSNALSKATYATVSSLMMVPIEAVKLATLRLLPTALPLFNSMTSPAAVESLVGPVFEHARCIDPLQRIRFIPQWARCEQRNVALLTSTHARMLPSAQRSIVIGNILPRYGIVSFSVRIVRERMTAGHSLKGGYFVGVSTSNLSPLSPTNNAQSWKLIKPPVVWALHDTSPQLTHAVNPTVKPNNFQRTFGSNDLITVVVNRDKGTVAFYRNGEYLKELYNELPSDVDISPFVQMYNDDASVTLYPGEITPSVTAPGVLSAVAVDSLRAMLTLKPFEAAVAAKLKSEMEVERLPSVTLSVFGSLPDVRSQLYQRVATDETRVTIREVHGARIKFSIGNTTYYDFAQNLRLPPCPTIRGPMAITLDSATGGICSVVEQLVRGLNRVALPLVCEAAVASLEVKQRQLILQEENDTRCALHSDDRVRVFKQLHAEANALVENAYLPPAPPSRYTFSAPLSHPGFVFPPSYCGRLAIVPTGSQFTETPFIAIAEPAIPATGKTSIRCQLIRGHHGQILGGGYYFGLCMSSLLRRRRDMNVSPPDVWALHDMDDNYWRLKHLSPERRIPVASEPSCLLVSGDIIRLEIDRDERTMSAFRQPANASDEIPFGVIFENVPKDVDLYPFIHLYNFDAVAILLPSTPRTPPIRTTTQQQRMAPALSEKLRSCDGCISQHRDTRLHKPHWYKCNECADYNLCALCFYLYVHNGHTFTQMDSDMLLYSASPPTSLSAGQQVVVSGAPVEFLASSSCSVDPRHFNNLAIAKTDDAHALWGLSSSSKPSFTVTVDPFAKSEPFPFNRPVFVGIAPLEFAVRSSTETIRNACLANASSGDGQTATANSSAAAAASSNNGIGGDSVQQQQQQLAGIVVSHCSDNRIRPKIDRVALKPYGFTKGSCITITVDYTANAVIMYRDWTLLGTIPLPDGFDPSTPLVGFVLFSSKGSRASVDMPLSVMMTATVSKVISKQLAIVDCLPQGVGGGAVAAAAGPTQRIVSIGNCRALLQHLQPDVAANIIAQCRHNSAAAAADSGENSSSASSSLIAPMPQVLTVTDGGIVPCTLTGAKANTMTYTVMVGGVAKDIPLANLFVSPVPVERDGLVPLYPNTGYSTGGKHFFGGGGANGGASTAVATTGLGANSSLTGGVDDGSTNGTAGATLGDGFVISRIILTLVNLLDDELLFDEVSHSIERLMTLVAQIASVPVSNDTPFSYLTDMRSAIASTARLVRTDMYKAPLGPLIPELHFDVSDRGGGGSGGASSPSAASSASNDGEGLLLAVVTGPLCGCVVRVTRSTLDGAAASGVMASPDRLSLRYGRGGADGGDTPQLVKGVIVYRPNDKLIVGAAESESAMRQRRRNITTRLSPPPPLHHEVEQSSPLAVVELPDDATDAATTAGSAAHRSTHVVADDNDNQEDANLSREDVTENVVNNLPSTPLRAVTATPPPAAVSTTTTTTMEGDKPTAASSVTPREPTASAPNADEVSVDLRHCVPCQQCGTYPWWNVSNGLAASYLEHAVREKLPDEDLAVAHTVCVFLDGDWHGELTGETAASSGVPGTILALSLKYEDDCVVGTATLTSDAKGTVQCTVTGRYHRYERRVLLVVTHDPLAALDDLKSAAMVTNVTWDDAVEVAEMSERVRKAAATLFGASSPASPTNKNASPTSASTTSPTTPHIYTRSEWTFTGLMDAEGMKTTGTWRSTVGGTSVGRGNFNITSLRGISIAKHQHRMLKTVPPLGDLEEPAPPTEAARTISTTLRRLAVLLSRHLLVLFVTKCPENPYGLRYQREVIRYHAHPYTERFIAAQRDHCKEDYFTVLSDAVGLIKAPSSKPWDLPTLAKIITRSLKLQPDVATQVPSIYWDALHGLVSAAHSCGSTYRSNIIGSLIELVRLVPATPTLIDILGALFAWVDKHTLNPLAKVTQRDVAAGIELVMAIPQQRYPSFATLPIPTFQALVEMARCLKYERPVPRIFDKIGQLREKLPEVAIRCPFGTLNDRELKVGKVMALQKIRVGSGGKYYYEIELPERQLATFAVGWGASSHQDIPSQHVGSDVHSFAFCGTHILTKAFKEDYRLQPDSVGLHGATIGALIDLNERQAAWSVNGIVGRLVPIPMKDYGEETELCAFVSTGSCSGLRVRMTASEFAYAPDGFVDLNGNTLRAQMQPFTKDEVSSVPPRGIGFYSRVSKYMVAKAARDAAKGYSGTYSAAASATTSGTATSPLAPLDPTLPSPDVISGASSSTTSNTAVTLTGTQHLDPTVSLSFQQRLPTATATGSAAFGGGGEDSSSAAVATAGGAVNGGVVSSVDASVASTATNVSTNLGPRAAVALSTPLTAPRRPTVTFQTPDPEHDAMLAAHHLGGIPAGDLLIYASHVRVIESCMTTAFRYVDLDSETADGMLSTSFRLLRSVVSDALRRKLIEIPSVDKNTSPSTISIRSADLAPLGPRSPEVALQTSVMGQLHKVVTDKHLTMTPMFRVALFLSNAQHFPQDLGGPYRQLWTQMTEEMMRHPDACYPQTDLHRNPLFRFINNSRRVALVPDSLRCTPLEIDVFKFFGKILGHMARARTPLALDVSAYVWKFLVEAPLTIKDFYDDVDSVVQLSMRDDEFFTLELANDVIPGFAEALAAIADGTATVEFYTLNGGGDGSGKDWRNDVLLEPRYGPASPTGGTAVDGSPSSAAASPATPTAGGDGGAPPKSSRLRRLPTDDDDGDKSNDSNSKNNNNNEAPLRRKRGKLNSNDNDEGASDEEGLASITGPQSLLSVGAQHSASSAASPSAAAAARQLRHSRRESTFGAASTDSSPRLYNSSSGSGGAEGTVCDPLDLSIETRRAIAEYCLVHSMDAQLLALRAGLWSVLPRSATRCMCWGDLETAVCGDPNPSLPKLKEAFTIMLHATREMYFWRIVEEMSGEQRSALLCFASGQKRLPLVKKIRVAENAESLGHLPRAQSCSSLIIMPMYTSYESMRHKLLTAIAHTNEMELA